MLITSESSDILCSNFQSLVDDLGEDVTEDEKLLHHTGSTENTRLVLSKSDRIGLWYYELAAMTNYDETCLLNFKLSDSGDEIGDTEPVHDIGIARSCVLLSEHPRPSISADRISASQAMGRY